jgi:competence protein ComEC
VNRSNAPTTAAVAPAQAVPPFLRRANYQPLMLVVSAASAGIAWDAFAAPGIAAWWGLCLVCAGLWLAAWLRSWNGSASVLLLAAAAALGGSYHHLCWNLFPADDLASFMREEPQPVALRAIARLAPRHLPVPPPDPLRALPAEERSRMTIEVTAIRDGRQWRTAGGQATLISDGWLKGIEAGDELLIFGSAARTQPPGNPGELDFAAHNRADRIRSVVHVGHAEGIQVVQPAAAWHVNRWLDRARFASQGVLRRHIDAERTGFAAALLLNAREQLDFERMEVFFETNTIHFLAISGFHVAILAGSLFWGLRAGLLPRRAALLGVAGATVVYTLITDAPPSAVRAAVLVIAVCLSLWWGRPALSFNTLAAAALVVLALNPADLFRAGPQLSFLAVATMSWFGPLWRYWQQQDALQRLIARTRPWPIQLMRWTGRWFLRMTYMTAAVWLVTLPLIMARFHLAAPVAIVLSVALALPMASALLSGFGVLVAGWLFSPLAAVLGWICDASLWATDLLVEQANGLPYNHVWVAGPNAAWLAVFYGGLAVWSLLPPLQRWPKSAGLLGLAVIAVGAAWPHWQRAADGKLQCHFLAVGHGCGVVVELPDGRTLLYDAGRLGSPYGGARSISSFLWSRGITHLDMIILSHADVDHYNALPYLLEQISADEVYVSPLMFQKPTAGLDVLRGTIENRRLTLREVWQGRDLPAAHGCSLRVLHPPREGVPGSDNANSIVLLLEFQGRRILLTGDLEDAGLLRVISQPPVDCDVILAPHHGSIRSNPPGFANWSTPEWVAVSGGFDHGAGDALAAYERQGARVLSTARDGAVSVNVEHGRLAVEGHARQTPRKRGDGHRSGWPNKLGKPG